jgi:hypothetical protein
VFLSESGTGCIECCIEGGIIGGRPGLFGGGGLLGETAPELSPPEEVVPCIERARRLTGDGDRGR